MTFIELAENIIRRNSLKADKKGEFLCYRAWASQKQVRYLKELYRQETKDESPLNNGTPFLSNADGTIGYRLDRTMANHCAIVEKSVLIEKTQEELEIIRQEQRLKEWFEFHPEGLTPENIQECNQFVYGNIDEH